MADMTDDVIKDDDADTRDIDDATKADEEQAVADTDEDAKDVDRSIDDVISKIDGLESLISSKFDDVAKLFISSGATVSETVETPVTTVEEDEGENLEDLDYSL